MCLLKLFSPSQWVFCHSLDTIFHTAQVLCCFLILTILSLPMISSMDHAFVLYIKSQDLFAATWMGLEIIILNDIKSEKDKYNMISLIYGI